jgi:outer membrane lipopolysaccharide assembly protein LptE/RlpB
MKNIILITLIFFLSGCGYSSIYDSQKKIDFQINVEEMKGDNEFNNLIKKDFKLFSKNNLQKEYLLKINSDYKKVITSKNSAGVASNYNILATVEITVKFNNKIDIFQFQESINIKPNSNAFEQQKYENNIKRNFASSIREKLIIKILDTYDN